MNRIALALLCTVALAVPVAAQQPPPKANTNLFGFIPLTVNGQASTMTELYRHGGGTARRPSSIWRMSFSPQATLFNEFGMGMEMLLSSEGSNFRQNINQVGFNPRWRFVTVHAGDFSRDYSPYTLSGTRIRGGGIDVTPGKWEFSLQAGRAQRTVASEEGGAYKRAMIGAAVGYGREGASRISLSLMKAKDDPNSLEQNLLIVDTTFADTALVPDRLLFATSPQENLVLGLQTEFGLFNRRLHIKTEGGASLFTRDLRSQTVDANELGALGVVNALQPLRLSTSGDYAYKTQIDLNLNTVGLRGGYEHVGAGYTSLGLPYLISDRSSYTFGGNAALFNGRLNLQAETNHQSNNLLSQLAARTDRSMNTAAIAFAATKSLNISTTVATSGATTPATTVAPAVDAHTFAFTTDVSTQKTLLGKSTSLTLAYGFQRSTDDAPNSQLPTVTGNNVTAAVMMALSPTVSFGPSVSAVRSSSESGEKQSNALVGFIARAKLLAKQQLVTSANVTNTFSAGRQVLSARADASYPLPYQTRLSVQARHIKYAAFANRPGFNESFLTMSLGRSFKVR
ncbi:MAG TPA: hypothetical protein VM100_05465 [Longimicrobiales bacterium]|nr:hypothetical protein [Longimicrobiales bacterium]